MFDPPALRFSIAAWSAWAPGLTDAAAWRAWATSATLPVGGERPELSSFPPLLRRRAERLARMALHTALALRSEPVHAPSPISCAVFRRSTFFATDERTRCLFPSFGATHA